jgi:hypothetical protein
MVLRVQRFVAEAEVGHAAPAAHAGLGDHFDPDHSGLVILRRERVGVEADLLNLILRRQPAAAEAVDEDLRARPAMRISSSAISSGSSAARRSVPATASA